MIATLPVEEALAWERKLLDTVASRPDRRFLKIWQSSQSLVAPARFARMPKFAEAAAAAKASGWPVALRSTGGDVTPQGVGVVNVTHVYAPPSDQRFDVKSGYADLCGPIEAALGPEASRGWQPGAFCDGAYNVQWRGLKFAGTALRFRRCRGESARNAVLAHALMLMSPPSEGAINALNTFLSALGEGRVISRAAHTGLPDGVSVDAFVDQLSAAFMTLPGLPPLTT